MRPWLVAVVMVASAAMIGWLVGSWIITLLLLPFLLPFVLVIEATFTDGRGTAYALGRRAERLDNLALPSAAAEALEQAARYLEDVDDVTAEELATASRWRRRAAELRRS